MHIHGREEEEKRTVGNIHHTSIVQYSIRQKQQH
jgi:hypothetical protein